MVVLSVKTRVRVPMLKIELLALTAEARLRSECHGKDLTIFNMILISKLITIALCTYPL